MDAATTAVLIAALLAITGGFLVLPWLWRRQAEQRLSAACAARRAIVLSYDDGPGQSLTPKLLDLLRSHNARANFFMLGSRAATRPDIVARAVAEGHEVGSHSFSHRNAWKTDPVTLARDFARGRRALAVAGADNRFFRPPYGKMTIAQWLLERQRGTRFAWWSVDSKDSWDRRPIDAVVREIRARQGGVVLMHDYDDYPAKEAGVSHAEHLLALTAAILETARQDGLQVMTLGELRPDRAT